MFPALIWLALAGYLFYSLFGLKRPKNFPPGPTNYPFVGASLHVNKLANTAYGSFGKLGEKYGPITGFYLGNIRTVIINGFEATKEFYAREEFIHRPNLFLASYRWGGRMLGVFFSNGRLWQEQRRFTLRHLRDFGFGKTSMEGLIHEESQDLIKSIKNYLKESPDSVISIQDKFGVSVINIIWAIIAGVRYKHDDAEFKQILKHIQDSFRNSSPAGNLVNSYPFLRHLPWFKEQFKLLTSGSDAVFIMLEKTIADHKGTRKSGEKPRDFIDVYLEAMQESEKDPNSTFSHDQLVQLCEDLFAAGSESTSNSIAFAILHMLRNPEIQEKVHQELDNVVGRDRLPSYADKPNLPYTFAAITESLRMTAVGPISVPHYNIEDTKLMGYDVPKGTWVMVNYMSTNMNPKFWGDPENFRPERFLDSRGKFSTQKLDHVMGFGAGKRQCLGEPLARMSNYLIFTAIMQRFKFEIVPGTKKPSIEPMDGISLAPQPFSAKVTVRF